MQRMRKPKLFWISAAAPLVSVILSTLLVTFFRSKLHGIATIGHLKKGLNPPSANMLYFHGQFLGVATKTGIITGILSLTEGIAVRFLDLLHVTRPNTGVLGKISGTHIYQNVNRYKEARRVHSFVILGVEAPIYFANFAYLQERILRWIREEEEWLASNHGSSLRCVIIDMTAVTGIDTSGLTMVKELKRTLEKRSLQV